MNLKPIYLFDMFNDVILLLVVIYTFIAIPDILWNAQLLMIFGATRVYF